MNVETLLLFLSSFGLGYPDAQPAWPSFFQPHGPVTTFEFTNETQPDDGLFTYTWETQDHTYTGRDLPLDTLRTWNPCEGAFEVTLTATHPTGAVFSRTECVWVVWSFYDFPECDDGCTIADCGWWFYPEVESWHYRQATGFDVDADGTVTTMDLLQLLSQ